MKNGDFRGFFQEIVGIALAVHTVTGDGISLTEISEAGRKEPTMQDKKTLSKAIVDLQTQTGAPSSFVRRIESELLSRGIPLDEDASPYIESLEEAFMQDLCNREDPLHVRDNIEELQATYFNLKGEHDRLTFRMEAIADALRKHMSYESDTVAFGVVPGPESVN